jgi:hypothetical protein
MNLDIYNAVRKVPDEAKKTIGGGRLKGMTDINPMWRIETLTRQFGPCGIGWKVADVEYWQTHGANGEVAANCRLALYIKIDGEWSAGIEGIGGSMFVAKERDGLYTSDEAYKMAYTDALSVACKMLGVGADVYWQAGTKYTQETPRDAEPPETRPCCADCGNVIKGTAKTPVPMIVGKTLEKYGKALCLDCAKKANEA